MKKITIIIFYLVANIAGVYSQEPVPGNAINARAQEKYRDIKLPDTDVHGKRVKGYVEDIPDEDYFHASEVAYESFNDFKFGIRIHWGIYSIQKMNHESWGFLTLPNEKKQEYQNLYKQFNPTAFNAEEWMSFFDKAGLKCFAFTTKHHEGFSMFDTKTRIKQRANYIAEGGPIIEKCDLAYSIMETPYAKDIVKELCDAAHRHNIKIDLYYSHPDWYDADFRPYNFHPLQTQRSKDSSSYYYGPDGDNFTKSYSNIITPEPNEEETQRMISRHRQQLTELLTNYGKIDMICLDQWMGPKVWPQMKATVKLLRKLQPDVMLRARGIGNYGDYYTPEGFVPGSKENTKMPWMVIHALGSSFSYDSVSSNYKGSTWIIGNLIDAVAKGGNFMVGIGPDATGKFHPTAVSQLLEAGQWLKINGEGIYSTRARNVWKEGDFIRFTTTKDNKIVYAFFTKWPGKKLVLESIQKPKMNSKMYLLGYKNPIKWEYRGEKLIITIPDDLQAVKNRPCTTAWAIKIQL
jgi:alpha-L-fucosidase